MVFFCIPIQKPQLNKIPSYCSTKMYTSPPIYNSNDLSPPISLAHFPPVAVYKKL